LHKAPATPYKVNVINTLAFFLFRDTLNTVTDQIQGGIEKLAGGNGRKLRVGRVKTGPARTHSWPLWDRFGVGMAALSATPPGCASGRFWANPGLFPALQCQRSNSGN